MPTINWNATKQEHELIGKIVKRAVKELKGINVMDLNMDISAAHCNGNPLDLEKLLSFDEFNFSHDVYGIMDHINRENGHLEHGFLPRSTKRQATFKLIKNAKGKKFQYTVLDEDGKVISTRTSTREYVACTANGEFYFGRLDLIGKGDHGRNLKAAEVTAYQPAVSYHEALSYFTRDFQKEWKAENPFEAWKEKEVPRAIKRIEVLKAIAYL